MNKSPLKRFYHTALLSFFAIISTALITSSPMQLLESNIDTITLKNLVNSSPFLQLAFAQDDKEEDKEEKKEEKKGNALGQGKGKGNPQNVPPPPPPDYDSDAQDSADERDEPGDGEDDEEPEE